MKFFLPKLKDRRQSIDRLLDRIMNLPMERVWRVTIEEAKPMRSDAQNNALWGVAYKAIREQTGNEKDALHEYFCGEYFGWTEARIFGQRRKRPLRTTTTDQAGRRSVMSTRDFGDFYAFIQQRMADNDIQVPDPDPNWQEQEECAA